MNRINLNTEEILILLNKKYFNSTNICIKSNINGLKWQNIQCGRCSGFNQQELENINETLNSLLQQIEKTINYIPGIQDLLNSPFILLKPLLAVAGSNGRQYERCLQFRRNETLPGVSDFLLLNKAFKILLKDLSNSSQG